MTDLILTTYDWVPDCRAAMCVTSACVGRWKRRGCPIASRARRSRPAPEHFAHQPFGQVPWLTDGDISIFESGAILLHLGERSEALMPADPRGRSEVINGCLRRLIRLRRRASLGLSSSSPVTPTKRRCGSFLTEFLNQHRLQHIEPVVAGREWLAGAFSVADILMADVLRLVDRFDGLADYPACRAYVARATARPAFVKAHADQMAHFAAAD